MQSGASMSEEPTADKWLFRRCGKAAAPPVPAAGDRPRGQTGDEARREGDVDQVVPDHRTVEAEALGRLGDAGQPRAPAGVPPVVVS